MYRYKEIIGHKLAARLWSNQDAELHPGCFILNTFTKLGMLKTLKCNIFGYRGGALLLFMQQSPFSFLCNKVVNIDTECVFGGKLTVLRYPELELVSVKAMQTYYLET